MTRWERESEGAGARRKVSFDERVHEGEKPVVASLREPEGKASRLPGCLKFREMTGRPRIGADRKTRRRCRTLRVRITPWRKQKPVIKVDETAR